MSKRSSPPVSVREVQRLSECIHGRHWEQALGMLKSDPRLWRENMRAVTDGQGREFSYDAVPIFFAVIRCEADAATIAAMVRAGAPLEMRGSYGSATALYFALTRGGDNKYEVAEALVDAGARCDALDDNGRGILVEGRAYDMPTSLVRKLVEGGARVDGRTQSREPILTMLFSATHGMEASQQMRANLEFLVRACSELNPDVSGAQDLPLVAALDGPCWDLADLMVSRGARWDQRLPGGQTLLHAVTSEPAVKWLLARDPALLNAQDERGRTPLYRMLERELEYGMTFGKNKPAIQALLAHGADPDLVDEQRFLPTTARAMLQRLDKVAFQALHEMLGHRDRQAAAHRALAEITATAETAARP